VAKARRNSRARRVADANGATLHAATGRQRSRSGCYREADQPRRQVKADGEPRRRARIWPERVENTGDSPHNLYPGAELERTFP
jgi:hypothetical protein